MKTFVYMDAITVDTPILSDAYRARILDVDDIYHRLDRCERFLAYLGECSNEIRDIVFQQGWSEVRTAVETDIKNIYADLERRRGG